MCAKKAATTESDPMQDVKIYLGPTLHRRTMVAASCYRGGLTDFVQGLVAKIPDLATLIVPLGEAATTRRRVKELGTEENRVYQYLLTVRFDKNGEVRS